METKKDKLQTLSRIKIHTGQTNSNKVLYYFKVGPDRAFVRKELIDIPDNNKLPPESGYISGSNNA